MRDSLASPVQSPPSTGSSACSVLSHENGKHLEIAVIESTMMVYEYDVKKQRRVRKALTVFNVIVEDKQRNLSLVRYVPDFIEFDKMIKLHYRKCKLSLPPLSEPDLGVDGKRARTLRSFILSLSKLRYVKPNSEKIEWYLRRCALDPFISRSSLFRDFLSAQREEDSVGSKDGVQCLVNRQVQENQQSLLAQDDVFSLDPRTQIQPTVPQAILPPSPAPLEWQPATSTSESLSTASSESMNSMHSMHSMRSMRSMHSDSMRYSTIEDRSNSAPMSITDEGIIEDEDPPQSVTIQDFQFIKVLGKGCMGKVLLVRHLRTSRLLALKAISKEWVIAQGEVEHARMERNILTTIAHIRHPFLVKLHHSFQDSSQLFLVLDYHVGGDLATQLAKFTRFTPDRARLYTAEIVLGLQELHGLGILYRDLKPENILLAADGHIVLTDFGLSKQFTTASDGDDYRTRTFCGTAEYLSPELLRGEDYAFAVDFWSLGTILFEMLTGVTPFWADTYTVMYNRIMEDPLEFPEDFEPVTANFIIGLLERNPADRLGAGPEGPITIRSHPYFDSLCWSDVFYKRTRPPYVPLVRSETDFSNFDRDFLEMTPRLSPPNGDALLSQSVQQAFQGYSYTNESQCLDNISSGSYRSKYSYHGSSDMYDQYTESDIQPHDYYRDHVDEPSDYGTGEENMSQYQRHSSSFTSSEAN
ncbi:kinase-like domain-containing protein [Phycomyces nitens]|nr:kinase-like domain-containing protein [Phycomyces nitens]